MIFSHEQQQQDIRRRDKLGEAIPPRGQNKVNWHFATLLLGNHDGRLDVQAYSLTFFHPLSIGIANVSGWFHTAGVEEWKSITNAALFEQIRKFLHWSKREILQYRANGRFAYLGRAIKYRILDEIRRVEALPFEVATSPDDLVFARLCDTAPHPDAGLRRDKNLRMIEEAKETFRDNKQVHSVLDAIEWFLVQDPNVGSVRDTRARFTETVAERAMVSRQQAGKYIKRFREEVAKQPKLKLIANGLRCVCELERSSESLPVSHQNDGEEEAQE